MQRAVGPLDAQEPEGLLSKLLAYDLETHKVQPGLLSPPIVCGSIAYRNRDDLVSAQLLTKTQAINDAKIWLESEKVICGMNIAYDFGCLAAAEPSLLPLIFAKYRRGQVHDVGVALMLHLIALGCCREGELFDPRTGGKLKDPSKGTITNRVSLAVCVDVCLGRTNAKENDRFRLSYALLEHLPHSQWPDDARQYPVDDAINTLEVAEWQLVNCRNQTDLAAQCETAWALHLSSMWGVRTNAVRVEALAKTLQAQRDLDVTFAVERGFMRPDGTKDTKKIKAAVSEAYMGNPPPTDGGGVSTSKITLEESGDDDLIRFMNVAGTEAQLTRYLPVLQEAARVPLNVRPNTIIANGRSSYDGIIQTFPREGPIRECFESRPGYTWCSVDWAAVEMSTLAQVCLWTVGESRLADALNKGVDPHSLFGAEMSGVNYEVFLADVKAGKKVQVDVRQATKGADFGLPGMMGAVKLALAMRKQGQRVCLLMRTSEKCGLEKVTEYKGHSYPPVCKACVLAAEDLKRFYLYRMWHEMPKYFQWITTMLEKGDELEQFVSKRVRGGLNAPSAANTLFSGLAADMFKSALREITRECYLDTASPLYGSRIVLATHDETMLEIPDEKLTEAAARQCEIMNAQAPKYCPDVLVKSEPAAMKVWRKAAKTVLVNGKLIPWTPHQGAL